MVSIGITTLLELKPWPAPVPDIFLSYNREDQATARRFAEALQAEGLEVWWDATLRSGEAYDQVTEEALKSAKAVVVLWSPRSVVSRWVRAEATLADRNKTLLPAMIEPCERPIMFELTQTAELSHWQGDVRDEAWQAFVTDVKRFVGATPRKLAAAPADKVGAGVSSDRLSICVLPFANMSGDAEQEYFSDGISEDIITDLSKVSALAVISRNTAFSFKGRPVEIRQVASQLGVSHVLEGSVRKSGARVRITAQLIEGSSDNHVWAERFDRDLDDIFALQDEISQAIVGALKLKLLPQEKKSIEGRATSSVEAYDTFLRARALHATMAGPEVRRSIDLYRKAVGFDPDFAQAWAGLAAALSAATIYYADLRPAALPEIEQAFARATELAPDLPDVHTSQLAGCLMRNDWAGAEDRLARLENVTVPQIGVGGTPSMVLCTLGRAGEAVKRTRKEQQSDPLAFGLSFGLQFFLGCTGQLEEAEAEYERSRDLPGNRGNLEWRAITRAMVLKDHVLLKERFIAAFGKDADFMPFAPRLAQALDRPDEALEILHAAFDDPACQDGGRLGAIAHWAVYFGDDDFALKALRRGYVDMTGLTTAELWSPVFAGIRRDQRFKQIVRDIGLADHWRRSGKWGDFARPVGDDDFEIFQ
jgi:TolB-like protein